MFSVLKRYSHLSFHGLSHCFSRCYMGLGCGANSTFFVLLANSILQKFDDHSLPEGCKLVGILGGQIWYHRDDHNMLVNLSRLNINIVVVNSYLYYLNKLMNLMLVIFSTLPSNEYSAYYAVMDPSFVSNGITPTLLYTGLFLAIWSERLSPTEYLFCKVIKHIGNKVLCSWLNLPQLSY